MAKPQLRNHPPSKLCASVPFHHGAGKARGLKSRHPKVLHRGRWKAILAHVIATATKVVPSKDIFVIIGPESGQVRAGVAPRVRSWCRPEQRVKDTLSWLRQEAARALDQGDGPLRRRSLDHAERSRIRCLPPPNSRP